MPSRQTNKIPRVCEFCGVTFLVYPSHLRQSPCRFCSCACNAKAKAVPIRSRFERYVGPPEEDGCVLWTGCVTKHGYGRINSGPSGGTQKAHRVAWELANGPIPPDLFVLHRCDNPPCVNVEHLFLGTPADNMADMVAKGRSAKGGRHSQARLMETQVIEIRRLYATGNFTQTAIATQFGVDIKTISRVVYGESWTHV